MNLIQMQVEHSKYGAGTVVGHVEERIIIDFSGDTGEKSFLYPEAFEQHLRILDPVLQAQIGKEVQLKAAQRAADQLLREQQREAEHARLAEEKLQLKNDKSKSRRKAAQAKNKG